MDTTLGSRPGFLLWTRDIQLVGPNGLPAIPLGQFLGEGITTNTTNSITGDFIDTAFDKTFYYLTDGSPGDYTLYYLSDPVAEGRLD
ncbi:MAG: hypothetical protein ACFCVH_19645 [Alphaproteobacteria bacterium]